MSKEWIHVPMAAALAAALSAAAGIFFDGRAAPAEAAGRSGAPDAEVQRLAEQLVDLAASQEAFQRSIDELAGRAGTPGRVEVGGLDAAVARWMEENTMLASTAQGEAEAIEAEVDRVIDLLLSGGLDYDAEQELWQRLRDEGRIDAVVAELEALVETDPNDPDLRVELGDAYVQKIFDVGVGPMAGVWGQRADEAFDQALALDEGHWEARFSKAISLSNWPAFLGKSGAAIQQFEILRTQQEGLPQEARFAQTYYFLGNLHQQNGDAAAAYDAWRRGLELFPGDEMLLRQLEVQEGHR